MTSLYPLVDPYEHGMLSVGDGNFLHWELSGAVDGKPAVVVHGGPGSGSRASSRCFFDPDRYRLVLFDQRGCGRSTPHASDPGTDMAVNTTDHLVADLERLREHLGIDRWLLFGGSWGSTLILAYATRHPDRVSGIVIAGVTMTRRSEIDWLYGGLRRFFPEDWERFRRAVADAEEGADVVAAYSRRMENADPAVREAAAAAWVAWEDAVISMEPHGTRGAYSSRTGRDRLAFVRICTHYFAHAAWLEENQILREAGRLAGIPGTLIHGRLDMGSPLVNAWELARAWPDAQLRVVDDAGHIGGDAMSDEILAATDGARDPR